MQHELAVRLAEENRVRAPQDQLALPSRATLARRIATSNLSQEQSQRRSQRTAKSAATQYGQTPYPDWPLERVEIDHTRTDLIVIDDRDNLPLGRLTLTYCLDTATRYPLGYYLGFEPPSYLTVMECLHHAICPKPDVRQLYGAEHAWLAYGIPATLVIDNGKEFIGHDLADACLLLGIVLQYTPVQTPQFKASVERMFGSLNTMLFHTLPGTTFADPAERGNYQSAEQACVYLSVVDKLLNIFLVDIYAERFHRGLGAIPARCWAAKTQHGFAPALPPSAAELTILLGPHNHPRHPALRHRVRLPALQLRRPGPAAHAVARATRQGQVPSGRLELPACLRPRGGAVHPRPCPRPGVHTRPVALEAPRDPAGGPGRAGSRRHGRVGPGQTQTPAVGRSWPAAQTPAHPHAHRPLGHGRQTHAPGRVAPTPTADQAALPTAASSATPGAPERRSAAPALQCQPRGRLGTLLRAASSKPATPPTAAEAGAL